MKKVDFAKQLEVLKLRLVLLECDGNRTEAAKRLGISRTTVHRLLAWDEERIIKEMELS
jgi:transcriptional regulator of acetoin/glycerol metabolism